MRQISKNCFTMCIMVNKLAYFRIVFVFHAVYAPAMWNYSWPSHPLWAGQWFEQRPRGHSLHVSTASSITFSRACLYATRGRLKGWSRCSIWVDYKVIRRLFKLGGPMIKILVLRNKRVFKGLFIHLIRCEHDQVLGPPFFHVFKQVGHWSTYLEKKRL